MVNLRREWEKFLGLDEEQAVPDPSTPSDCCFRLVTIHNDASKLDAIYNNFPESETPEMIVKT